MINIAIKATYYIFCCRNRNWDSPELMQFWFLFFFFLSFFSFLFSFFFCWIIQSQAAFVICLYVARFTFKNTNTVSIIIVIIIIIIIVVVVVVVVEYAWFFTWLSIHVFVNKNLSFNYSGAPTREARQRSTMVNKIW